MSNFSSFGLRTTEENLRKIIIKDSRKIDENEKKISFRLFLLSPNKEPKDKKKENVVINMLLNKRIVKNAWRNKKKHKRAN